MARGLGWQVKAKLTIADSIAYYEFDGTIDDVLKKVTSLLEFDFVTGVTVTITKGESHEQHRQRGTSQCTADAEGDTDASTDDAATAAT